MFEQECVPYAPSLIESMRSLGYSFPAAIADLIDNSISAKAKRIDIIAEPSGNPSIIILDDGEGMDSKKLYEAMRYGSTNPLENRNADDLGRFGLGLKSASLSQCRRLIVVSKQNNVINSFAWDLDYVIQKGKWMLKGFTEEEISEFPNIDLIKEKKSGTYIYLSEFDRVKAATGNISETFNKCLDDMVKHLALVFHRFIEEGLVISLNNLDIEARDPFLLGNKATQRKKESCIYIKEQKITLKPFILPHLSKLSQDDLIKIGGKENLRNEQGFYVYRNKRLIIWGTWFRLERKDELNKLARVRVDIPNSLDYMWSIDIKKSTATLPDIIKKNMYNAVYDSVLSSETVHAYRGRKEKKDKDVEYVWERIKIRDGYGYVINRDIPQIKLLEETMDDKQKKLLNTVIQSLESSFPVGALYVDAAKGNIDEKIDIDQEIEKIWDEIQIQMDYVRNHNLSILSYCQMFMKVEPYCKYEEIKKRIQEEINRNE